uniref:Response regulator receiver domain-containing protein n=1 Tax=Candidatus Kentrum sp. TUN TaxID=2126343 RepID=A0A450ZWW8_9GAMM|nr:MAG: hypothetical protein BECKTUN1418F_GA0071002_10335 [Candidatus Kentron sp. TUN]VFK55853.1 MAG: hypothetical protein BECKTUN1418E_GA0071001_10345 [Candidatus Kentron sp. TUN]VFK58290.1 MAG: hypothetical protein BECKTUN1418D_GA0071000_10796 [Candidatus Kentron sp. TUN]
MKYLFVDDQPNYLDTHQDTLKDAGHEVEVVRDIGDAWSRIEKERENGTPFELVIIDLGLDREIPEFESENRELRKDFRARSGQALGLRLWRRRKELKQRYCYLTNNPWILVEADGGDSEFGGKTQEELDSILVLDKSGVWPKDIEGKLQRAYEKWQEEGWLP